MAANDKTIKEMETYDIRIINKYVLEDHVKVISYAENKFYADMLKITKILYNNIHKYKILLVSGPSASGKTTTANIIMRGIKNLGCNAIVISLDNFFRNREDLKEVSAGIPDIESIDALDIHAIKACFYEIIYYNSTKLPIFDFVTGTRLDKFLDINLTQDTILIVEGLHALNSELFSLINFNNMSNFYKLYVNVESCYGCRGDIIIDPFDLRLMRRLIRDFNYRNFSIKNTMKMWKYVISAEKKYVEPYKNSADKIIDTTHAYEPMVYKKDLIDLIDHCGIKNNKLEYLRKQIDLFSTIPKDNIPINSLIKEFIKI